VDLVAWQIAVAEGKPLPMTQAEIDARRRGAAIECRVYAEDPIRFLPSPGTITSLRVPTGPWVRDDSGVTEGSQITVFYDPMISKLVTWGDDRAEAIARMRRALDEYRVGGIKNNLPFHRRLLAPYVPDADQLEAGIIASAVHAAGQTSAAAVQQEAPEGVSAWRRGSR
jgi:acetyl-CoA carboxylase, biotin carboxylase subunit